MALTHFQKKFIKSNIRTLPLDELSRRLELPKKDILEYLKDIWREEKYQKYLEQQKNPRPVVTSSTEESHIPSTNKTDGEIIKRSFTLRFGEWIRDPFNLGSLFFLALIVIICYANSLGNVFISDDIFGIVNNKRNGDLSFVFSQFTFLRPLLYYFAYKLGGLTPAYFRMINILLHMSSVWVAYLLLCIFTKRNFALLAAAVFAAHPIIAESVTWISGGGYAQFGLLFLITLTLYILATTKKGYIGSVFFYLLALLSSPTATPLSGVIVVYEFLFGNIKKNWRKVLPFLLLSIFWIAISFKGIGQRIDIQRSVYYQDRGVDNPLLQIPIAISSYIELILWPNKLTLYHSELNFTVLEFTIRALVTLIFFGSMIYFYKKNKLILFWQLLFVISLLLTLTPLRISWIVAERYVYLGSLGLIFIFSYFLYKILSKIKVNGIVSGVFIVIVILFMARTILRNMDWHTEDSLWISTGKTSPSSPNTHNNLGDVYTKRGDLPKAAEEFMRAIQIKPNYADAYHNLANTYLRMGKRQDALTWYQKSLEINPNLWQSEQNIAEIYFEEKNFTKAEEHMRRAISLDPSNAVLYKNLSIVLLQEGKKAEAKTSILKSLELDPTDQNAKSLLPLVQ